MDSHRNLEKGVVGIDGALSWLLRSWVGEIELTFGCSNVGVGDHGSGLVKYPDCCGLSGAREMGGRATACFYPGTTSTMYQKWAKVD